MTRFGSVLDSIASKNSSSSSVSGMTLLDLRLGLGLGLLAALPLPLPSFLTAPALRSLGSDLAGGGT